MKIVRIFGDAPSCAFWGDRKGTPLPGFLRGTRTECCCWDVGREWD